MSIILGNEPVLIRANGKEANLLTNQIAQGTQYFCFDSGNGTKLYGEYKSLPTNLKLPTFEELKDDTFKEPFPVSDLTTPSFKGWTKNNDGWDKIIVPNTTVLIKEPTQFTAAYEYMTTIVLFFSSYTNPIKRNINVIGNKLMPLDNTWFESIFPQFGIRSWSDIEYFIISQGTNIYKVYKDQTLQLQNLDEEIALTVQPAAASYKVTVQTLDWAGVGGDSATFNIEGGTYPLDVLIEKAKEQLTAEETAFDYMGTPIAVAITSGMIDTWVDVNDPIKISKTTTIKVIGSQTRFNIKFQGDGESYTINTVKLPVTVKWNELEGIVYDPIEYYQKILDYVTLPDRTTIRNEDIVITSPGSTFNLTLTCSYWGNYGQLVAVFPQDFNICLPNKERYLSTTLDKLTESVQEAARRIGRFDANELQVKAVWDDSGAPLFNRETGEVEMDLQTSGLTICAQGPEPQLFRFKLMFNDLVTGEIQELVERTFESHLVSAEDFIGMIQPWKPQGKKIMFISYQGILDTLNWPPTDDVELPYYPNDYNSYRLYMNVIPE